MRIDLVLKLPFGLRKRPNCVVFPFQVQEVLQAQVVLLQAQEVLQALVVAEEQRRSGCRPARKVYAVLTPR